MLIACGVQKLIFPNKYYLFKKIVFVKTKNEYHKLTKTTNKAFGCFKNEFELIPKIQNKIPSSLYLMNKL